MLIQQSNSEPSNVVVAGTGTRRRMHTSGVTGGFAGLGMHYHRRAESAPELDAIDRPSAYSKLDLDPASNIEPFLMSLLLGSRRLLG